MHSNLKFAPREVSLEKRSDGSLLLRSPQPLGPTARCVTEWLVHWALKVPERVFLSERRKENWPKINYLEAYGTVRVLGPALPHHGLGPVCQGAFPLDNCL